MVHDARFSRGSRPAPARLAIRIVPARRATAAPGRSPRPRVLLPVIGPNDVILPTFDQSLGDFALRAQTGDREARDALYMAFHPKLARMLNNVRAPYAPDGAEGIWTRDDVEQEGYLAFVDLVESWTGETSFTAYLLSRFTYRVRDTIQRGIGKPSVPPRHATMSLEEAAGVPAASDMPVEVGVVLEDILSALEPPLDHVLARRALDGASIAQISAELGVTRRTVSRYWAQCRTQVEELLPQMRIQGHGHRR